MQSSTTPFSQVLSFLRTMFVSFWWFRPVLDSCCFVLTRDGVVLIRVDSCWLALTRVDSCRTCVDSCWTRVGLVLICADSCWLVSDSCWPALIRVDSCWYSCIRIDLIERKWHEYKHEKKNATFLQNISVIISMLRCVLRSFIMN